MASPPEAKKRAKLYRLQTKGDGTPQWLDQGTGHARCDLAEEDDPCIIVISEKDESVLLKTQLFTENIYHQERDTLIVWQDPHTEEELALSFSDKQNCREFWDLITDMQEMIRSRTDELSEEEEAPFVIISLPTVNQANLGAIHKAVRESVPTELAGTLVSDVEYLDQLFDLGESFEASDRRRQHIFFDIIKHIVLLNEANLLEVLFSERYMMRLVAALENDPEVPMSLRESHCRFLEEQSALKKVVPIDNQYILSKIHQTYRIRYLKDTVLSGALDEPTMNTISTMIFYNNFEIINTLQEDEHFLRTLFDTIRGEQDPAKLADLIAFLKQFCEISKALNEEIRSRCFHVLLENGLAGAFEKGFAAEDPTVLQDMIEVFSQAMLFRDVDIREYILDSAEDNYPLLTVLSRQMVTAVDAALMGQFQEVFRRLVDTTNIDGLWRRKEEFLSAVYRYWFPTCLLPAMLDTDMSAQATNLRAALFDLLSFSVSRHGNRIRSFLITNNFLEKVLAANLVGPGFLKLATIRLFRQVVGDKDRKIERYYTTRHLFDPLMAEFRANCDRYNMVNSAIIELFDFVDVECGSNHRLIGYLVERFRDDFAAITYVPTFRSLLDKYQTHQEFTQDGAGALVGEAVSTGKRRREVNEEEEAFFDLDTDQDDATTPPLAAEDSEESEIGEGLPPLRKAGRVEDEDDDDAIVVPRWKRRRVAISVSKSPSSEDPPS